ncbi:PqiB family protein [Magnetospirillum molischianum]|nr:MlaD family protein [Magnetospirillum molischianum]
MSDDLVQSVPEPDVHPPRRWVPSMVWLVPLLAALIGASLVIQALREKGPTITVSFATAEGIEPGKTKVKFKAVDIGEVTALHLAEDRSQVLVTINLVKEASKFAVADSRFWVVRPRLAGSGVSGLDTLLSGSYIGVDAGYSDETRDNFTGLESPPVVSSDVPGRRFVLNSEDIGSLDVGSPVFFRRIPVGHIESTELAQDGRSLSLRIFVKAPYDRFVTTSARFWHASGIDLKIDANGVKVDTQSLASILMGGIAFETPAGSAEAEPAQNGAEFPLAADHGEALKNPEGNAFTVLLRFHQTVRGLTVGAPVDFRGVEMGRVRSIDLIYDRQTGDFSPVVMVDVFPERLAIGAHVRSGKDAAAARAKGIADLVRRGLRAQLRTGSLLTGQLFVALDFFPDAPPVRFDSSADPMELPTVAGDFQELYQQVQGILRKLDKVPFDTLGQDTHKVMVGLDASLKSLDAVLRQTDRDVLPEIRDSLKEMRKTVESLQTQAAADSPLQQDTRQALQGLAEAARSLKTLTDTLDRQPESLLRGKKDQNR